MKRYHGNQKVGPGIYFNLRELAFRSVEDDEWLPGDRDDVWREVPALVMLVAAPVVGLAFVIFLPLIGFLMLGGLAMAWAGRQAMPAFAAFGRVLRPAWQPALAFFARGKARDEAAAARPDPWLDEVRDELAARDDEEREP